MFVPSNAIPYGSAPTAKVPSVAPAGDSSVTSLPPSVGDPHVRAVERDPARRGAHGEGAERRARRRQLGDVVVAAVGDPHVRAVERDPRRAERPTAKVPSVAPAGDSSVTCVDGAVGDPHVRAVERDRRRVAAHGEGAERRAGRRQLGDGAVAVVGDPHVRAVERDPRRAGAHGEGAERRARRRQLGDVVARRRRRPTCSCRRTRSPYGLSPTAKVPRGPHVGVLGVQAGRIFLQAPAAREATGARGARQSWAAGGQTLQGPVAQSHAPPELPELEWWMRSTSWRSSTCCSTCWRSSTCCSTCWRRSTCCSTCGRRATCCSTCRRRSTCCSTCWRRSTCSPSHRRPRSARAGDRAAGARCPAGSGGAAGVEDDLAAAGGDRGQREDQGDRTGRAGMVAA